MSAKREVCPTCMGKKFIQAVCEVSPEWEGIKTEDQENICTTDNICSGQLCTTDNTCPTCNGNGYVGE